MFQEFSERSKRTLVTLFSAILASYSEELQVASLKVHSFPEVKDSRTAPWSPMTWSPYRDRSTAVGKLYEAVYIQETPARDRLYHHRSGLCRLSQDSTPRKLIQASYVGMLAFTECRLVPSLAQASVGDQQTCERANAGWNTQQDPARLESLSHSCYITFRVSGHQSLFPHQRPEGRETCSASELDHSRDRSLSEKSLWPPSLSPLTQSSTQHTFQQRFELVQDEDIKWRNF